jgi:hypothetical protein
VRAGEQVHCTVKRSEYDVKYGLSALGDYVELTVAVALCWLGSNGSSLRASPFWRSPCICKNG